MDCYLHTSQDRKRRHDTNGRELFEAIVDYAMAKAEVERLQEAEARTASRRRGGETDEQIDRPLGTQLDRSTAQ